MANKRDHFKKTYTRKRIRFPFVNQAEPFPARWFGFLFFIILDGYAFKEHSPVWAIVLFLISLMWLFLALPQYLPFAIRKFYLSQSIFLKNGFIWFCWVFWGLNLLSAPMHQWLFPHLNWIPFPQAKFIQIWMFVGLVGGFRWLMPSTDKVKDLSKRWTYFWFWVAMVLAIGLRIYHMHTPEGSYGPDESSVVGVARHISDLKDFHWGVYLPGSLQPFFCYFIVFLWQLVPHASTIFISRLGSLFIEMANIVVFYWVTKEFFGRRAGVIAAFLGAVSQPLMIFNVMAIGLDGVSVGMGLIILFLFKWMKKPSWTNFLLWAGSLILGIYIYATFRLFVLFAIIFSGGWILFSNFKNWLEGWTGWWIRIQLVILAIYYLYIGYGFSSHYWISKYIDRLGNTYFGVLLWSFLIFIVGYLILRRWEKVAVYHQIWMKWVTAVWICTLVGFPILDNPNSLSRLNNLLNQGQGGGVLDSTLGADWGQLKQTFDLLFWAGTWPANMGLVGDAFFGFGGAVCIILGIAYFLAKPQWKGGLVFLFALVGILPHVIAGGIHNARLLGCITPLYMLAAFGINVVLENLILMPRRRFFYWGGIFLLLGFLAWNAYTTFNRVYVQWAENQELFYATARKEAIAMKAPGNRIYFNGHLFNQDSAMINDGNLIYQWTTPNYLYVTQDHHPQNLIPILDPNDPGLITKLHKEFPRAQWVNDLVCVIPFQYLASVKGQNLFVIKKVEEPLWTRQFVNTFYGLDFDLVDFEDKVKNVAAPINSVFVPDDPYYAFYAARYLGKIHIDHSGEYVIHYKTDNQCCMKIDGKTILNLSFLWLMHYRTPEQQGEKTIYLTEGEHQVQVVTVFQENNQPPDISLGLKGTNTSGISLWSSFDF